MKTIIPNITKSNLLFPGGSSDEQCSDEQFQCADKCIPKRWQCDYHKDCENGEDEYDCRKCLFQFYTYIIHMYICPNIFFSTTT